MRNLPQGAATVRAVHGDSVMWGPTEHLLAGIYDLVNGGNWQRSGGKTRRPKPLPRPGDNDGEQRIGTPIPLDEMRELVRKWDAGELEQPDRETVEVT